MVVALEVIRNKNVSGIMVRVYFMIYFMEKEAMVDTEIIWGR